MWKVVFSDLFERKLKFFRKKHEDVLEALLENLRRTIEVLTLAKNPQDLVKYGKVRNEGNGLLAVDQRGAPRKLREARLYFFPDPDTLTLHLITIGFKDTQPDDCKSGWDYIRSLKGVQ